MSTGPHPADALGRPRTLTPAYWLLGLGLLAAYLPTLARGATFTDAPEITTAIHRLGVIHPTGYPIFTLLAHAFTRLLAPLPLLVIVKVELFNALCGVGAALFTAGATARVVQHFAGHGPPQDRRRADLAGIFAGLFVGICPLLWEQVRIAEVYSFELLLVCAAGYAWLRFEISRNNGWVVLAALPMGMGLAHHVTTVYMLPAGLIYLLVRKPLFFASWVTYPVARVVRLFRPGFMARTDFAGWWAFPVACVVGFTPMLSYYYLIWANAHTDAVTWGDIHDWSSLYDHVTGKQYQGFLKLKDLASYWKRIARLPVIFDEQFLPAGTALFLTGCVVLWRRSWRLLVFLGSYLLLNVAHGVYYSVGDYANYFLPAVFCAAVLVGFGLHWVWLKAQERPAAQRLQALWLVTATLLAATAITVFFYAARTRHYSDELAPKLVRYVAWPFAVVALLLALVGLGLWLKRIEPRWQPGPKALPNLLTASLLAILIAAMAVRGRELARRVVVGESYGTELATLLPRGAVLLTQGDGYLFSMWYQHHVHDRGIDFMTLDMGNLKTPWYQRYLQMHYPAACDPLAPSFLRDPEAYERKCSTFRLRTALNQSSTWGSLGLVRGPTRTQPVKVEHPIVRGADPQCAQESYRNEHLETDCRCWDYGKKAGFVEEDCVYSLEEAGIVPREPLEVHAHRIIEDVITQHPVYERNMFTRWLGDSENKRKWVGPAYLRPPGQYDLINRGRFNQIVFHADAARLPDPCAAEQAVRISLRPLVPARALRRNAIRETYEPNDRATLLTATFLTTFAAGTDDDATREFRPGDAVHLHLEWFEQFHYDASKPDRRGQPIHEGLRVCVFDPDGHRLSVQSTVSGSKNPNIVWRAGPDAKLGTYLVQACSTGEVGELVPPLPDDLPCQRIVLEYEFALTPKAGP